MRVFLFDSHIDEILFRFILKTLIPIINTSLLQDSRKLIEFIDVRLPLKVILNIAVCLVLQHLSLSLFLFVSFSSPFFYFSFLFLFVISNLFFLLFLLFLLVSLILCLFESSTATD